MFDALDVMITSSSKPGSHSGVELSLRSPRCCRDPKNHNGGYAAECIEGLHDKHMTKEKLVFKLRVCIVLDSVITTMIPANSCTAIEVEVSFDLGRW